MKRALVGVCAAAALLVLGVGGASAQNFFHGIAFTKGCDSPVNIGSPLNCSYQIINAVDTAHDTLTVSGLNDQVHAFNGDVNSGNILGSVQLVFSSPTVTCVGGSGAGTAASPYIGATSCTLPFGTSITTNSFSFYTVQAADFNLGLHSLTDTATLTWADLCDVGPPPPNGNCTTGNQTASAGSSATVLQLPSTTATLIHNAAHAVVTAVGVGTTVHDFVTVTGVAGAVVPTGNVNIDWFLNGTCTGNPATTSGSIGPLDGSGNFDATAFNFTVNTPGAVAFRAHYLGDATYVPSDGPCEPLQVVDANIQITPATATNPVNTNHTLTGHVNVNPGNGFVNAPDGTVINFTIASGPGSFVNGVNSCTTAGGTGSCTVAITSATAGTTMVHATTDVSVGGVVLHRETNGQNGNSGDAQKIWINPDANIQISPLQATNPVGTNHTLTGHVNVAPDGVTFTNAPDGTMITFSLTNAGGATAAFVGPSTCTTAGGTGSCTVVISSPTAGTTTINASTTVTVNGVALTRTTNGTGANSGPATKVWLDSAVTTRVLDASNTEVTNTTVPSGTVVHDEATVAPAAGSPAGSPTPTGTVTFTLFNGNTCNGSVVATDPNKPLAAGVATSVTFTTPNAGGLFSYLAHYNGDANYPARDAACEPFQVNAVQGQGRITGGGSIFATVNGVPNVRVTHGFELRCDANDKRQSLEINWAGGNNFHLSKLINSVVCFDDPLSSPPPPPGTVFDTYAGNTLFNGMTGVHGFGYAVGTGTCNKLPATIYFILIDNGEPGNTDIAEYHITGGCTLDAGPAFIQFGNHQFHKN